MSASNPLPPLKCEVCGLEDAVGVASVPVIPYSAAYGRECLRRGADPYWIVRANIACCGGPTQVAEWVLDGMTWLDGEYVTLREALVRYPMGEGEISAWL